MFTSRAEYRLRLREDNADERLMPRARDLGLIPDEIWSAYQRRMSEVDELETRVRQTRIHPSDHVAERLTALGSSPLKRSLTLEEILRRPQVAIGDLATLGDLDWITKADPIAATKVENRVKYAGYIARLDEQVERFRNMESMSIPMDVNYHTIGSLSTEVVERLDKARPDNLGQASRMPGITPAAITTIMMHLKRRSAA